MFLEQFAKLVYQETAKEKKKTIQYSHLGMISYIRSIIEDLEFLTDILWINTIGKAKVVREVEELEFLNDIIPEQTPL